ncbi:hypothetical protein HHUSO_G1573 [Huso huso]|uniref:SAM domain-containing protein n=1 Tax=Huso huso TaxID=61971 RepID=A0ABR1ACW4_HUSHU
MEAITSHSSCEEVREALLKSGFSETTADLFYENEVDGMSILNIKDQDLFLMLPNKIGLVRKLIVMIDERKAQVAALPSSSVVKLESPSSSSLSENELEQEQVPEQGHVQEHERHDTAVPNYSDRIKTLLENGRIIEDFDKFIEETAYYVLSHGDITSRRRYAEFGRHMYEQFPCIGFSGQQPWSFFCKKLSQKIRNLRWKRKKGLNGYPDFTSKITRTELHSTVREIHMTLKQCTKLIADELRKPNVQQNRTLLKHLQKISYKDRRQDIAQAEEGAVQDILKKYPLLSDMEYIHLEFQMLIKVGDPAASWTALLVNLEKAMSMERNNEEGSYVEYEEVHALQLIVQLQSKLKTRSKGKKLPPAISVTDAPTVQLSGDSNNPPRLLVIHHQDPARPLSGFVITDRIYICKENTLLGILYDLLGCYYAWNLSFPVQYQVLGFLQSYLLKDGRKPFFKSSAYIKFQKTFESVCDESSEEYVLTKVG